MRQSKKLARGQSPPDYPLDMFDYNGHMSPDEYETAAAGAAFVWALIFGSLAVISVSVVLIAKCIRKVAQMFSK